MGDERDYLSCSLVGCLDWQCGSDFRGALSAGRMPFFSPVSLSWLLCPDGVAPSEMAVGKDLGCKQLLGSSEEPHLHTAASGDFVEVRSVQVAAAALS